MKAKFLSILLAMVLLVNLAACSSADAPGSGAGSQPAATGDAASSTSDGNAAEQSEATLEPFNRNAALDETVLVDDGGIKITATGLTYTDYSAELALTIENNSGKDLASIAFGYPNATLPGRPQTPAAVLPERRKGETPKLRRGGTSVYF